MAADEEAARWMQAVMLGQDPERMLLERAPNTVEGLLKHTTDRLLQVMNLLIELDFLKGVSMGRTDSVPEDDLRKHIAERVLEGLKNYDRHYGKSDRWDYRGKAQATWMGNGRLGWGSIL